RCRSDRGAPTGSGRPRTRRRGACPTTSLRGARAPRGAPRRRRTCPGGSSRWGRCHGRRCRGRGRGRTACGPRACAHSRPRPRLRDMAATETRLLLLGTVMLFEPVNGYQPRRELLSWEVEDWAHVNPGSIYSGLTTLAKQGLVDRHDLVDGSREVAVYTSTEAGREEFR